MFTNGHDDGWSVCSVLGEQAADGWAIGLLSAGRYCAGRRWTMWTPVIGQAPYAAIFQVLIGCRLCAQARLATTIVHSNR